MRLVVTPAVVVMLLLTIARPTVAQTLGDVAKQEAERRKAVVAGKVYTNESLRPEPPPAATSVEPQSATATVPASPAAPTPAGQAAAAATPAQAGEPTPMTEDAWRQRITSVRDALSRAQIFAEALQTRVNALTTDFVNRDDPAQRDAIAAERQKALAEMDRVKRELADHRKAIADIQDEARRAGVPAGWVR